MLDDLYLGGACCGVSALPVGACAVGAVPTLQGGLEAVVPLLLPAVVCFSVWIWKVDF